MVTLAGADGATSCWDGKYDYRFGRRAHAIREAGTDDNPATIADSDWELLVHLGDGHVPAAQHATFPRRSVLAMAA